MPRPAAQPRAYDLVLVAGLDDQERRDLAAGLLRRAEHIRAQGFGTIAGELERDALTICPVLVN